MQNKSKQNPISLKFLLFFIVVLLIAVFYISAPSKNQKKVENKSFESMLEYRYPNNDELQHQDMRSGYIDEYNERNLNSLNNNI